MFGILVGCLAAVIGGAIAFGLCSLLPKAWQRARSPISILVALCVVALVVWADPSPPTLPRPSLARVERVLLSHPDLGELMTAWKETDPSAFASFIEFAAEHGDGDLAAVRSDPRFLQIVAIAGRRLAYLSDEQAVERFHVARDQMLELKQTNPALCAPVFHNRGVDFSNPPFSRPLNRRFLAVQASALRLPPESAPQAMTDAEVQIAGQGIAERLRTVVGDDIALLAPDAVVTGNEVRFCEVAAEYFNQVSLSLELARLNAAMVRLQHGSP